MRVQIASALNIICQVARLQDGSRKVTHITEVTGFDTTTQKYQLNDIFVREYDGTDAEGKVISRLVPTGYIPHAAEHIEAHGGHLPPGLLEAARTKRSR
jgi:pilus assembly protein CpaF